MAVLDVSISMLLVMLLGAAIRRRGYLTAESTSGLSRFAVDVTFPALVFVQLLATINAPSLRERWYVPVLGAAIIVVGEVVGALASPFFARKQQRRTFIFLVAIGNWIFLPLPIARELYGQEGVQTVLLINVGAQLVLWTLGIGTLEGGRLSLRFVRNLLLNPGMVATMAGVAVALLAPEWAHSVNSDGSGAWFGARSGVRAMRMTGELTVPLSLLITGSQLGATDKNALRVDRELIGILVAKLVLTPLAVVGVLAGATLLGAVFLPIPWKLSCLIAAMPTAVSCSLFATRFGGDVALSTRAIFYTTIVGLLTVSALSVWLAGGGI